MTGADHQRPRGKVLNHVGGYGLEAAVADHEGQHRGHRGQLFLGCAASDLKMYLALLTWT